MSRCLSSRLWGAISRASIFPKCRSSSNNIIGAALGCSGRKSLTRTLDAEFTPFGGGSWRHILAQNTSLRSVVVSDFGATAVHGPPTLGCYGWGLTRNGPPWFHVP